MFQTTKQIPSGRGVHFLCSIDVGMMCDNNVLLVKIEGPAWYTSIYHHYLLPMGKTSPSVNEPTNGKKGNCFCVIDVGLTILFWLVVEPPL